MSNRRSYLGVSDIVILDLHDVISSGRWAYYKTNLRLADILFWMNDLVLSLKLKADMENTGIITKISGQNFDDTYKKLKTIITNNPNLKVIFELDHQANANAVSLDLPPTKIIFFGNPRLGTPLMAAGTFTGLDLPQKILVTERDGVVSISYNDPNHLRDRHQIEGQDEVLLKVMTALDKITTAASQG